MGGALAPHIDGLMTSEDAVREQAIEVAAALGIRKIIPRLIERVTDAKLIPAMRANSLRRWPLSTRRKP